MANTAPTKYRVRRGFGGTAVLQAYIYDMSYNGPETMRQMVWRDVDFDNAPAQLKDVSNG